MHSFFSKPNTVQITSGTNQLTSKSLHNDNPSSQVFGGHDFFPSFTDAAQYDSDYSTDNEDSDNESEQSDSESSAHYSAISEHHTAVPPLKHQKLVVPYCQQRIHLREEQRKVWEKALLNIEMLLKSKRTKFHGGSNGLQIR